MHTISSFGGSVEHLEFGVSSRPCLGERVSGDLVWFKQSDDVFFLALIDALGHGKQAHAMASTIEAALSSEDFGTLGTMIRIMHDSARSNLGAAASVVRIDTTDGALETMTIGNTTVRITKGQERYDAPPTPGVLGQSLRTPLSHSKRLSHGDVVILFSDGVSSEFGDSIYHRLSRMSAESISRLLLRKYGKSIDDASVAVIRYVSE